MSNALAEPMMSQLPIATPFELTLENELGIEAERFSNDWLFKWHGMTYERGETNVDDFRGGRIHYAGTRFEFQQREIFWSAIDRYLDRKVHDTFRQWDAETRTLPTEVRINSIDGIERTLRRFVAKIVALGRQITDFAEWAIRKEWPSPTMASHTSIRWPRFQTLRHRTECCCSMQLRAPNSQRSQMCQNGNGSRRFTQKIRG